MNSNPTNPERGPQRQNLPIGIRLLKSHVRLIGACRRCQCEEAIVPGCTCQGWVEEGKLCEKCFAPSCPECGQRLQLTVEVAPPCVIFLGEHADPKTALTEYLAAKQKLIDLATGLVKHQAEIETLIFGPET